MRECAAVVLSVALLGGASLAGQQVPLDTLLVRAGFYVAEFVDSFANVVAEEEYLQETMTNRMTPMVGQSRGTDGLPTIANTLGTRRRLKSDFLLVTLPQTSEWLPFRDVFEVDGAPVRDREQRLTKLFLESSATAVDQARKIAIESARYNLGNVARTFNNPVIALALLQTDTRKRFRFSLGKQDRTVGPSVWIVEFREQARPTLIKGFRDRDVPSHGRFWIEPETGRIAKSVLTLDDPQVVATLTTTFRVDDRFQIDVPVEMHEEYVYGSNRVVGTATYGRFRRFDVTTAENVRPPASTVTERRTGLTLVEIPAGRFTIGSPATEAGRRADEESHDVTINRAFFLGQHEVTQQEWRAVMNDNPSRFTECGPRCPVENVSFEDVQRFLAALNAQPSQEFVYRLPTEAEWEYACRAGTATPFSTGATILTSQANYNGKQPYGASPPGLFRERPTRAGGFPANPWGLADMHGNVAEWTGDWYRAYAPGDAADPRGPAEGAQHVTRGGDWSAAAASTRCAVRSPRAPQERSAGVGFRVAAERLGGPR